MVEKQYNKRAWNSRLKIGSSLVNILLNKDLEDITVCELEKKAKVSRSTFYRNFGNVYDVLKINMDYYYNLYKLNDNNEDKLLYFFKFWEDKKELIYVLSKDNQDILINTIMKYDDISKHDAKVKSLIMIMFIKLWYEVYPKHNYYFMTEISKKLFTNYKQYI